MSLMLDVGGDWQFCFDNLDSGILSGWFKNKPPQTKKVNLPHIWQKEPKWQESHIGFYFKQFHVDKAESSKRFFIRFDSILHHAAIWLNGEELGTHMGGYSSFELDASKLIKIDESNLLVIRLHAPDFQGRINGRSSHDLPLGSAHKRAAFAGILGSVHDAEDIAQEAMLKGFTDIGKLREPGRFGPWLVKIARNLCINLIRRQKRGEKALAENAQTAIQPGPVASENDRLEQAIEKLSQEVRLPLVMYYLDGQNVKTVAQKLNVSRSGVYQKLRTGIKQLHELLTDQGESSDE